MTKFPDRHKGFCIEITNDEWDHCSLESKVLLLYRLQNLEREEVADLVEQLSPIVDYEKRESEIDFDKTFTKIYGEN